MITDVHALFCDDIRQEMSGKFILIGVYSGEMNVNNGPTTLPLSMWVDITGLPAGKQKLNFTVRKHVGTQRTEIARMDVEVDVVNANMPVALPLQGLPIFVDADCSFSLSIGHANSPERAAGSLKVKALFAENTQS